MKKTLLIATLATAFLALGATAHAQVAGSSTIVGVSVTEMTELARGWSARKGILGKTVYNDAGAKVGKVEDLIISPEKNLSYLIVGAGGFVGIGRHDVAIPIGQIRDQDGRIILPGATKDSIKALPQFSYTTDTSKRDAFIARADRDLVRARADVVGLENKAAKISGDARTQMDKQLAIVRQDMLVAEAKLVDLKQAGITHWKEFEADVSNALARVHSSLAKSSHG